MAFIEFIEDLIFFLLQYAFIGFMIFMWLRTATRSEFRDLETRIDIRLKRIHDEEMRIMEMIGMLDERSKNGS